MHIHCKVNKECTGELISVLNTDENKYIWTCNGCKAFHGKWQISIDEFAITTDDKLYNHIISYLNVIARKYGTIVIGIDTKSAITRAKALYNKGKYLSDRSTSKYTNRYTNKKSAFRAPKHRYT